MLRPIPKDEKLQFAIERNKQGFNKIYPKYTLLYQPKEGGTPVPLLVAKKRSGQQTSNYMISLNIKNPKPKGPGFMGKVRANGNGVYNIYGQGENPNHALQDISQVRN